MFKNIYSKQACGAALALAGALTMNGCGSSSTAAGTDLTSGTFSASAPSVVASTIVAGVVAAGAATKPSGASSLTGILHPATASVLTAAVCDTHGDPIYQNNGGQIFATQDPDYPGKMTYCKMTVDDSSPETVQGPFSQMKSIGCAVEKAGLTFDGVSHPISITFDTNCFTAAALANMGGTQTVTGTVVATQPAAFNTYFNSGVVLTITGFGTFSYGTKVTPTKIEFATLETGAAANSTTMYAGAIDFSAKTLQMDSRIERINCATQGNCGWNRHVRIFADLDITGTTINAAKDISFAYSDIQAQGTGQSGFAGVLVTASGDLTTGIQGRAWIATHDGVSATPTATTDIGVVSNWVEQSYSRCYTNSSDAASTCGKGLPLFTANTGFTLTPAGSYTSPTAYFSSYAGMTMTSVNLDTDIP